MYKYSSLQNDNLASTGETESNAGEVQGFPWEFPEQVQVNGGDRILLDRMCGKIVHVWTVIGLMLECGIVNWYNC